MDVVKVGMADLKIVKNPQIITTLGLGSCVGVVLYDPEKKLAGLAHIMLPDSNNSKDNTNKAKFADTAIPYMIDLMLKKGAKKERLISKIAGGAQMFDFKGKSDIMKIGVRNIKAVKENLHKFNINIVAEDVGGNYGRTIEFNTNTGKLTIRSLGKGTKEI
ncbi:MAG TPA: chemotaxis protein CheD [Thermoanaerobacterales bacterium]|nr:chemotaxis protein CheD [Thermoanaerobacterales bacterium]